MASWTAVCVRSALAAAPPGEDLDVVVARGLRRALRDEDYLPPEDWEVPERIEAEPSLFAADDAEEDEA